MSGTVLSQLILFFSSPIITRFYNPEEFGLFAFFTSSVAIISSLVTGKYELAVALPRLKQNAIKIIFLGVVLALCSNFVLILLLAMGGSAVVTLLRLDGIPGIIYFLPISAFISSILVMLNYWMIRNKDFGVLATSRVMQSGVSIGIQMGLGYLTIGPVGLIWGQLIGQFISAIILISGRHLSLFCKNITKLNNASEIKRIIVLGRKYKDFPRHMMIAGMLNRMTTYAPVLIFGWLFTPNVVGFFALAHRVIQAPMTVIGGSVADVFVQKATELGQSDPNKLGRKSTEMCTLLALVGFLPASGLFFFGPDLFALIFGIGWEEAGIYAQAMSIYLWMQFIFSPLARVFFALERQELYQRLEWIRLGLVLLGTYGGGVFFSSRGAIISFSIAMAISYLLVGILAFHIIFSKSKSKEKG
ncbi:oligosaccharide flippase family protein [Sporomusa sphaeroides]